MVINVGIYHDFRDLCPFFIDSYLLCIESFIIFASEKRFVSNLHLFEGVSFSIVYITEVSHVV